MLKLLQFTILLFTILGKAQQEQVELLLKKTDVTTVDSSLVRKINTETAILRSNGEFEKALKINSLLIEKLDTNKPNILIINTLYERAEIEYRFGKYNAALKDASQVLKLTKKVKDSLKMAEAYNQIGSIYYRKNQLDSTSYYYEKAYQLKVKLNADSWQLAIAAYNKALVQIKLLEYDAALSSYLEAINWYKKSSSKVVFLPRVYSSIAILYKEQSNFVKSQEYAALALEEANKQYQNGDRNLIIIYNHQATIARSVNEFEKAQPFIKKSLELTTKIYGENHYWPATVYGGLAKNYLDLKKVDSAFWAIKKAIEIGNNLEDGFDFGNLYLIESEILLDQNNLDGAIKSIKKSRENFKNIYGNFHWRIANTWLHEAKIYLKKGTQKEVNRALDSVFQQTDYDSKELNKLSEPFIAMEALQLKFKIQNTVEKWNTLAEHLQLIPFIKSRYDTAEAKLFFAATTSEIISADVTFCYEQYQASKDEKYIETAFKFIQLRTNSILAEEIGNSGFYNNNSEFIKVLNARKQWARTREALYASQENVPQNKVKIDSLLLAQIEASKNIEKAITIFETDSEHTPFQLSLLTVNEVQQKLNNGQQLLQYYVGKDYIYGLSFTENSVQFEKLGLTSSVFDEIKLLREAIQNRKSINGLDKKLYNNLMASFRIKNEETIIIADNFLSHLPFDILKNEEAIKLIETTSVSYLPAISLLNSTNKTEIFEASWAGFAVNYEEGKLLPQTENELLQLKKITNGSSYINSEVTAQQIFKSAKNSKLLHLSLHGNADERFPLYSKLVLNDTTITASSIYNENIASKLVVLNACETGYGKIADGEGAMSFARAFTFAGAESTLTSLWRIPDTESAALMVLFYKNIENGMSKSKALQQAKLRYLEDNTNDNLLQHPYYWAGLSLSGSTYSLENNAFYGWIVLLGAFVLIIGGVIFYTMKKRRKQ